MKKISIVRLLVAFTILLSVTPVLAFRISGYLDKTSPIVEPLVGSATRGMAINSITIQDYEDGWVPVEIMEATFNANGRCEMILDKYRNSDTGQIDPGMRILFTYGPDARLLHADWQGLESGEWVNMMYSDWNYTDGKLRYIMTKEISEGGDIPYFLVQYYYDDQSGRLASLIESYYMFNQENPGKNKYEYTWDSNGRSAGVQAYHRYEGDEDWVRGTFTEITYRPDDVSNYSDHLRFLESYYPCISEFGFGANPFRIADKKLYDFFPNDTLSLFETRHYLYHTDNRLDRIHGYMGTMDNTLYWEQDYSWDSGLIHSSTYRMLDWPSSEMQFNTRYVYGYTQVVDSNDPVVPVQVASLSVFPNPFNPTASIQYSLNKADRVKVEVFNLKGQRVNVLMDGMQSVGAHDVRWDGTDSSGRALPSGIYFLRVSSDRDVKVAKAVLTR